MAVRERRLFDAAALTSEDGESNPAAALLRLQRRRRPAELPRLAAALFGTLRRDGCTAAFAERLSDALMHMLAARFGGDETGEGHTEELRRALRYMEEPRMLAETAARWRREAIEEGMARGMTKAMSHERALLQRQRYDGLALRRGTRWRRCWRTRRTLSDWPRLASSWWTAGVRPSCLSAAGACSTVAANVAVNQPIR